MLPPRSIDPLFERGRWWPVTVPHIKELGFVYFAWVTPSEFIGDSIFTISGGFAYLHKDDVVIGDDDGDGEEDLHVLQTMLSANHKLSSRFYPIVRPTVTFEHPTERELVDDARHLHGRVLEEAGHVRAPLGLSETTELQYINHT